MAGGCRTLLQSIFGAPTGEVLWVPQKIRLRVQSASGAMIGLETIRLFKKANRMIPACRSDRPGSVSGFTLIENPCRGGR